MNKILILFAHPAIHKSRVNAKMIEVVSGLNSVTVNNLYQEYPDFFINIKKEQQLLVQHEIVIWHHPLYWHSAPSIIKEWFDLVLQHNFAYGKNGNALRGKKAISVITTGGSKEAYSKKGHNKYTIPQFLLGIKQSAILCKMSYLPPYVVHGTHLLEESDISKIARDYEQAIIALRDNELDMIELGKCTYLNDYLFKGTDK